MAAPKKYAKLFRFARGVFVIKFPQLVAGFFEQFDDSVGAEKPAKKQPAIPLCIVIQTLRIKVYPVGDISVIYETIEFCCVM